MAKAVSKRPLPSKSKPVANHKAVAKAGVSKPSKLPTGKVLAPKAALGKAAVPKLIPKVVAKPSKANGTNGANHHVKTAKVIDDGPKLGSIAGRNLPPAKAPRPIPTNEAMIAAPVPTNNKPRKNQAGLLTKELEHFRDLLLAKRGDIVGDMSAMEREALRTSGGSNLSTLPIHMADMGTDNYEQEFTLGLVETERKLLREINYALAKIQNGTFGICEGTGKPISKARLEVQPWAKYSIEYAKQMERGGR